jgi:hypothetical protein
MNPDVWGQPEEKGIGYLKTEEIDAKFGKPATRTEPVQQDFKRVKEIIPNK